MQHRISSRLNHMRRLATAAAALVAFTISGLPAVASDRFQLVAHIDIEGTLPDRSGLTGTVGDNVPHDRLGAFGSAIDFTGKDDLYLAAADRGPGDGVAQFRCRVHMFHLNFESKQGTSRARFHVERTVLLSDEAGRPLVGWSGAIDPDPLKSVRFDPEGVRMLPDGSFIISDEYGPWIDQFNAEGKRTRRFEVPERFRVRVQAKDPIDELPPHNTAGRQPNRGFEGLALSRDGSTLFAIPQSPLLQDGALDAEPPKPGGEPKRAGHNVRLLEINMASGRTREFVYVLDSPRHGLSEIAVDEDGSLIVLERDGKGGKFARVRRLYSVAIGEATDVSDVNALPREPLPSTPVTGAKTPVRPTRKTLLLDFMDPSFDFVGDDMPEKIEGVTLGPTMPDGRKTLVIASDNDMKPGQPTRIWIFAR